MTLHLLPIYLPIAELPLDVAVVVGLGGVVGFLSGLFGVGGGFLLTPLLILLGVAPAVAVSSQAPQIVAASVAGALGHWRRGNVDLLMGTLLFTSGLAGSGVGIVLFVWLRKLGQIDAVISIAYVAMLGSIGSLMAIESARALRRSSTVGAPRRLHKHIWLHALPLKLRFRKSRLYISALPPVAIGFGVGVLVAIMGVGGGFVLVPAMIFLLGMPTLMAVGTSLFQIIFVTAAVTLMHAYANFTVDTVLAMLLAFGSVVGAQWGARIGPRLKAEQLRGLLALLVLAVALKVGIDLAVAPDDLYSVVPLLEH